MNAIIISVVALILIIVASEWRKRALEIKPRMLFDIKTAIPLIEKRGPDYICIAIDKLNEYDPAMVTVCIDNMLLAAKGINDDDKYHLIMNHFIETADTQILRYVIRHSQYHKEMYFTYIEYMRTLGIEDNFAIQPKLKYDE